MYTKHGFSILKYISSNKGLWMNVSYWEVQGNTFCFTTRYMQHNMTITNYRVLTRVQVPSNFLQKHRIKTLEHKSVCWKCKGHASHVPLQPPTNIWGLVTYARCIQAGPCCHPCHISLTKFKCVVVFQTTSLIARWPIIVALPWLGNSKQSTPLAFYLTSPTFNTYMLPR